MKHSGHPASAYNAKVQAQIAAAYGNAPQQPSGAIPGERVVATMLGGPFDIATPEFRFCEGRRWRFDYAWPFVKVALEVQGGIWTAGRHVRGKALLKEWEKLNTAAAMGWRILYFQPKDLRSPATIGMIRRALGLCP